MPSEPSSPSSAVGSPGREHQPRPEPGYGRVVWTLGLGAFGLAFSLTTTAAYLPPLLGQFTTSATLIALGLLTGPLLAGAAIDLLSGHLGDTRGYQALWPILGVPVLLAIPLVWRLSAAERDRRAEETERPESII